jgi:hypothetical protein
MAGFLQAAGRMNSRFVGFLRTNNMKTSPGRLHLRKELLRIIASEDLALAVGGTDGGRTDDTCVTDTTDGGPGPGQTRHCIQGSPIDPKPI